jgi:hypothetical protein
MIRAIVHSTTLRDAQAVNRASFSFARAELACGVPN